MEDPKTGGDRISSSAEGETYTLHRLPHTKKQKTNMTDRQEEFREHNDGQNGHMRRWMTEWGGPIPTLHPPVVGALSRIGIGIVEGYYWQ